MNNIELKELMGGALQEQFSRSFESVVKNLQNPNTSFKAGREINIKLKFIQNEDRNDVKCAVQISEKLAPPSPMETAFAIGTDLKTGKVYAEEYGKHQMSFYDLEPKIIVDKETGEVLNGKTSEGQNKVIDLRKTSNA